MKDILRLSEIFKSSQYESCFTWNCFPHLISKWRNLLFCDIDNNIPNKQYSFWLCKIIVIRRVYLFYFSMVEWYTASKMSDLMKVNLVCLNALLYYLYISLSFYYYFLFLKVFEKLWVFYCRSLHCKTMFLREIIPKYT